MVNTRKLVEGSLLVALSVILVRFCSIKISFFGVDGVRIGIGTLPIIFAGLRSGAWAGAKVGALADIIGYLIVPGGPYMPHFTLTTSLYGVLPPLLMGKKERFSDLRLIMAVSITHFILSILIVPYFLNLLFGIPFQFIVLPRIVSFLLNIFIINFVLLVLRRKVGVLTY